MRPISKQPEPSSAAFRSRLHGSPDRLDCPHRARARTTRPFRKLARHEDEEFFISVITASEMLHDVHRARDSQIRTRRSALARQSWSGSLSSKPIYPPSGSTPAFGLSWPRRGSSLVLGPHDLWIAATAIAHGLTLVTANLREFRRVAGLTVEEW
ncbi:MAG TPA: PIN domain-containing protein [Thermoanaerobaculia bacterium]|nr:PIN domain-containing protein [Thermoanaerobaculia bacterium]